MKIPTVALTLVAMLVGCGEAGSDTKPVAKAASTSPSPATSASGPVTLKMGEWRTSPDGVARSTVHAYKQAVAKNGPAPDQEGSEWAGLEAEVCIDKPSPDGKAISLSQSPWSLYLANNGLLKPSMTRYGNFPIPEYPMNPQTVEVGRCLRGWIVFVAPIGQKPVRAEYAASLTPATSWALG